MQLCIFHMHFSSAPQLLLGHPGFSWRLLQSQISAASRRGKYRNNLFKSVDSPPPQACFAFWSVNGSSGAGHVCLAAKPGTSQRCPNAESPRVPHLRLHGSFRIWETKAFLLVRAPVHLAAHAFEPGASETFVLGAASAHPAPQRCT